jgi:hypothetical protein
MVSLPAASNPARQDPGGINGAQGAIDEAVYSATLNPVCTYAVQTGDTWDAVAAHFKTTTPRLLEANGWQANYPVAINPIGPGEALIIPDVGAPDPQSVVAEYPINMKYAEKKKPIDAPTHIEPNNTYSGEVIQNQNGTESVVLVQSGVSAGGKVFYQPAPEYPPPSIS